MRHFTTLEELGDLLVKDWTAVIDLLYPPINPLIFSSTESEVFRQWSAHEAFAMARREVFVRTPRIREMLEVLSLHAEVEQGIRRKTSMVVPASVLGTFMTSLPGSHKETLPPVLVLAGRYREDRSGGGGGGVSCTVLGRRLKVTWSKVVKSPISVINSSSSRVT